MNLSVLLAEQIFIMAILILFGYIFTKLKLINYENSTHLSQFCLYIICPCMLINSFQIEFTADKARGFFLAVAAAIVIHMFLLSFAAVCGKVLHFSSIERASFIYTNAGNLIVPIVTYVLGKEYVFYCCAFMMVQTFLVWTHGISTILEKPSYQFRKIITNPCILGTTAGMIMFFTGLKLPALLGQAVERTANCIAPVSMVIIGILIASSDLKEVFTRGRSWLVTIMRLIVCPVFVIFLLSIFHVTKMIPDADKILFVSLLAAAAPSASTVTQMASMHHKNEILAGSINIMTVLLCIGTMPLITILYQHFCM